MENFVRPGEKILLKPNMLSGDPPQRAVTTHPEVFAAVARLSRRAGALVQFGDSPGIGSPEWVARRNGIWGAAKANGVEPADFQTGERISFAAGLLGRQLVLARSALQADGIISLCKMKTHGLTRITGAMKNQFGCVPGLLKGEYHVKMPDVEHFSRILADITARLHPRLYIMDGILAMEGEGPRGGTPRPMNVLLFASDPVALDATFCRLIDLEPETIPTMAAGVEAGLGTYEAERIILLGDTLADLKATDFRVERRRVDPLASARRFPTFLKNWLSPRPFIIPSACSSCGSCVAICPVRPRAMFWPQAETKKVPAWDSRRCIRCYCCQEICPHQAISIRVPALGRLIHH